jgi:magnesium and cobalt exporter, CNNM family
MPVSPAAWVVVGALVLVNALYVSAEFGAVGARRSRIQRMGDEGHGLARRLLPYIQTPAGLSHYVAASQIGITLGGLILGAYAQATVAVSVAGALAGRAGLDSLRAHSVAEVLVLVGLAAGETVIGELVPKSLALQFPTQAALATVLPMQWSLRIFRPFILLINGTTSLILRLMGLRPAAQRHIHSSDEIDLLIAESRDGGLLEPDEQQRLHRALQLSRRSVRDLMVPLDHLTALAEDTRWDEVVRMVAASPFSRLPIYRGSPDQIVGTLRVKDLVHRYVTHGPATLHQLMRPIARVAQDLPADRLITVLRERRVQQAVVVDAGDRAVGLITIQDVLNALLGGIPARV